MQRETDDTAPAETAPAARASTRRAGARRPRGVSPAGLPVRTPPAQEPEQPPVETAPPAAESGPAAAEAAPPVVETAPAVETAARTAETAPPVPPGEREAEPSDPEPAPDPVLPPEPAPLVRRPDEASTVTASDRPAAAAGPLFHAVPDDGDLALSVVGLSKRFGSHIAVDGVDLAVPTGSFYGFVGPNGAGKTTTLAMVTGMLRPDAGEVRLHGANVWRDPRVAKKNLGVLPDRLRLFDRLTGVEYLHHAGALRGLDRETVLRRAADLAVAFGIEHSLDRFVADYSAGMVKKIAIAAAMIHSPRVLVLDEPFESVDPVSSAVILGILKKYVAAGGTVVLSSHSMELIERACDSVAIIADGRLLASGPMREVVGDDRLERRFVELAGGVTAVEGMEWLQSFSD